MKAPCRLSLKSTMTKHPVDVVMNDAYDSVDSFLFSLNNNSTTTTNVTIIGNGSGATVNIPVTVNQDPSKA